MKNARTRILTLPPVIDPSRMAALRQELQSALVRGEKLRIDAGTVSEVTSHCLQMLAAASIAFAQSKGPHLGIAPMSAAFRESAQDHGFGPLFEHVEEATRKRA